MSKFSTRQAKPMRFRAHGQIELEATQDNIVLYHSTGPFNVETFKALEDVEQSLIKKIAFIKDEAQPRWAEVIIFEKSCLATPDSLEYLCEYLKRIVATGRVPIASAYVIRPEIEGSAIMGMHFKSCHENAGLRNIAIFDAVEPANAWIKSILATHAEANHAHA
jgi:hypothetical protein